MIITRLELRDYRNYPSLRLDFGSGTNILYGDNAQGKTNILEAVYLAGTSKSHRRSKDKDIIRFGAEEAHVKMTASGRGKNIRVDVHLKKAGAKGIAVNGIPVKKASDLFGNVHLVFFSPEDLNLLKKGPSERRRFMDLELCQLDKAYVYYLTQYNRVMTQRNRFLKILSCDTSRGDELDIWDSQLATYGGVIIKKRREFINRINQILLPVHAKLTGQTEELSLVYKRGCDENFYEDLKKNQETDIKRQYTGTGPHRDDVNFYSNRVDLRTFGSQGQQRTAALSLKLSEIRLVQEMTQDMPVLLLDDVLSELDENRQRDLFDSLENMQTIITCTGLEKWSRNLCGDDRIFRVRAGTARAQKISV